MTGCEYIKIVTEVILTPGAIIIAVAFIIYLFIERRIDFDKKRN